MTRFEDFGGPWMQGSGQVVDRTNYVIAALLQQEFTRFRTGTLDNAIEEFADVHSDQSIEKYRERVIRHGPFDRAAPGQFRIVE
jgi:hypothetical protein